MNAELERELNDAGLYWNNDHSNLSELIQACNMPEIHGGLYCDRRKWKAWTKKKDEYGLEIIGEGSTPEEAVARLWLTLNKP